MSIGTGLVRRADQKKNEFWAFKTWDPECVCTVNRRHHRFK